MVNWDPIEQIKNQGPYCKRHSNLGLLIEFDKVKLHEIRVQKELTGEIKRNGKNRD
jgi:hypothetical protein